ncbi:hypothetical protein [Paraclostridium sordellii]|uniref:hypothetical protein n=1 Tax=Paraclostridium sordellii TaxID=1505 RepID=UPI0013DE8FAD|nr:hypothetical protein [Paeniclostridium sordellii]
MKQLLVKISEGSELDKAYTELKEKIEEAKDKTLSYSEIAQFVFSSENEDIDYLLRNLEIFEERANKECNEVLNKGINKVKNHIQLEVCRMQFLEKNQKQQLEKISEDTFEKFKPLNKKICDYEETAKKHEKTMENHEVTMKDHRKEIKNWNANIVTILGLFSAIVLTFFGGMSGIGSIFNKVDSISIYRLIFVIFIIIFAMFNIIFMLLYYIAIITGKHLNRECTNTCTKFEALENREDSDTGSKLCARKKKRCCFKRYPVIVYFNLIICIMIIGMTSIYEVNKFMGMWIERISSK